MKYLLIPLPPIIGVLSMSHLPAEKDAKLSKVVEVPGYSEGVVFVRAHQTADLTRTVC
jgi:hypothetical protein